MSTDFTTPELPAIGFVADMDTDDRRLLSSYGEFIPAHEGTVIIKQGDPQNSLFMVISGLLHVQSERDGRTTLLGRLRTGDMIGEINVFDPAKASATVVSVEFSQLWRINAEMLEDFLSESPVTAANLLIAICTQLSKRVRATNEKVAIAQDTISETMHWS
ncbi:MAG: Crp/Fnr family transcriptional regulator [Verrucomicrobiales bacterium]